MKNKYGLPENLLNIIRARDKNCVYCHKIMNSSSESKYQRDWATIEHLNHLPPWNDPTTVAMCCGSCNSSRSNLELLEWFKTKYCLEKGINENTVAEPVKKFIRSMGRSL